MPQEHLEDRTAQIGAGLGDRPWEHVRALLERIGGSIGIELVVFEEYVQSARHPVLGPSTGSASGVST